MKLLFLIAALCVTAASGCASPRTGNKAGERFDSAARAPMPSFRHLPDYMVPMHCDPFSKTAVAMLHKQGIPAHRITYGWSQFGGARGFHAAVLFQLNGKFYFMDNARMGPRPVAGKTDLGCVAHISGEWGNLVWMCNEENERVAPRKMADLFAPNPEWMKSIQVGVR